MSLTKGSKVEASDWNNLADAYNSEIVDRRKVTNVKITGAQIEQQINSNSTIEPLIAGLTATTNGRMVNEDGSLSSNTYSVAKGRGTLIYPLEDHQKVLLQLSKISVFAEPGKSGCYGSCAGLCASGCMGNCKNTCTAACKNDCEGTCKTGCTSCTGTCSGGCSSCQGGCEGSCSGSCKDSCVQECKSSCHDACMGCQSSHASQGCSYCECGNYPG